MSRKQDKEKETIVEEEIEEVEGFDPKTERIQDTAPFKASGLISFANFFISTAAEFHKKNKVLANLNKKLDELNEQYDKALDDNTNYEEIAEEWKNKYSDLLTEAQKQVIDDERFWEFNPYTGQLQILVAFWMSVGQELTTNVD